jgi:pyruvate-formate lyase-activating enzyme
MSESRVLTTTDHSRDSAGLVYVYPVVSRRSGGVSVGINLNPNNACNWRCVYCQVPNLRRGSAPSVDVARLKAELHQFLHELVHGDFMQTRVPEGARRINDIALSGNGEPTSAREFEEVVDVIGEAMAGFGLVGKIKLVLITNGSLVDRSPVRRGLARMASLGGEVWFKLDRATREGMFEVNGTRTSPARVARNLEACAATCRTWLQTCVFARDGKPPAQSERKAWLDLVGAVLSGGTRLEGVLLYGLARPSMQADAARLADVPVDWLRGFQTEIAALGLVVRAY